uniref:Uncharacterized protein n=1 Tax=Anguilla anguilla TaxID=7936 RepID=A0A0E9R761_ANGAN
MHVMFISLMPAKEIVFTNICR